jgi:dTDP-4-dehydrorhamnose 3,5-epimerase-like enzyme
MTFTETTLKGAFLIEPQRRQDDRGSFARTWWQYEFMAAVLALQWIQCNITFSDDTEVFYQMSQFHAPEYARGVHWDDPAFKVCCPAGKRIISERYRGFPDFRL